MPLDDKEARFVGHKVYATSLEAGRKRMMIIIIMGFLATTNPNRLPQRHQRLG